MNSHDLDYYLSLDYDVVISKREVDGSVLYKAFARELDPYVFYGAGKSKQEALENFEITKAELFELYLEEGRLIPEPKRADDSLPSGQFVLRLDPKLHLSLKNLANDANRSLNSYIDHVLTAHVTKSEISISLEKMISSCLDSARGKYRIVEVKSSQENEISEKTNEYCGDYSAESSIHSKKSVAI